MVQDVIKVAPDVPEPLTFCKWLSRHSRAENMTDTKKALSGATGLSVKMKTCGINASPPG